MPTRRIHAYIEGPTLDRMARHVPARLGQSVDSYFNAVLDYFEGQTRFVSVSQKPNKKVVRNQTIGIES